MVEKFSNLKVEGSLSYSRGGCERGYQVAPRKTVAGASVPQMEKLQRDSACNSLQMEGAISWPVPFQVADGLQLCEGGANGKEVH